MEHHKNLLNPDPCSDHDNQLFATFEAEPQIHIHILDDPITSNEVADRLHNMKCNKAAGADGIPPGILKLIADEQILLLTDMFNLLFFFSLIPHSMDSD